MNLRSRLMFVPLVVILLSFVIYHLATEPTVQPTGPVPHVPVADLIDSQTDLQPPPSQPAHGDNQLRQEVARSAMSQIQPVGLLDAIREDIGKGTLDLAETKLIGLPATSLSNGDVRKQVAILWNHLGLQQERQQDSARSIQALKQAASLGEQNPTIQLNLAHAYWVRGDVASRLNS